MALCSTRSPPRKRRLSDIIDDAGTPRKRHKQMKCLEAIRNIKPTFNVQKLQINREYSRNAARDDMFMPSSQSHKSKYIRWVLACKFVIASGLRFDSYNVWGMKRDKLPQNMSFYVDDQQNLCCLIYDNKESTVSSQIIKQFCKFLTNIQSRN